MNMPKLFPSTNKYHNSIGRGLLSRLWILSGAILLLWACHPPRETGRDLVLPEIISKDFTHFYPPEAYDQGLEGKVVLLIRIENDGSVSEARVEETSRHDILNEAALTMARILRFTPALVSGEPKALWMKMPVVFRCDDHLKTFIDLEDWLRAAREYQAAAVTGTDQNRRNAHQDMMRHYVHLAHKMMANRSLSSNRVVLELATPAVHDLWDDYQGVWPLSFVPFQDYLRRYSDSEYANLAENYLREYVEYEVSSLKKALAVGTPDALTKRQLLVNLTQLLTELKPDTAEPD
ncbi:MAG: energy transducer TonB [Fidelibacterota bacterium]|nr:MAG: energy transducer TonB [Candidatus Neomarinimicrobiota bacterium]